MAPRPTLVDNAALELASSRYLRQSGQSSGSSPPLAAPTTGIKPVRESGVVLASSMTLVFVVLIILPACILSRRRGHRRLQLRGLEALPSTSADDANKLELRRYSTVESWLVNKLVHDHDDVCEALRAATPAVIATAANNNAADALNQRAVPGVDDDCEVDEDGTSSRGDRECPICFEAFGVGDAVSWSANPKCEHVYHHSCIKEWLVERKECPFCRQVFLPVDIFGGDVLASHIPELILGQKRRCAPCFYCLEHHIVHVPPLPQLDKMPISPEVRQQIADRSFEVPDRLTLVATRRCERVAATVADADDPGRHDAPAVAANGPFRPFVALGASHDHSTSSNDQDFRALSEACHNVERVNEVDAHPLPSPLLPSAESPAPREADLGMGFLAWRSVRLPPASHESTSSVARSENGGVECPPIVDANEDPPYRVSEASALAEAPATSSTSPAHDDASNRISSTVINGMSTLPFCRETAHTENHCL